MMNQHIEVLGGHGLHQGDGIGVLRNGVQGLFRRHPQYPAALAGKRLLPALFDIRTLIVLFGHIFSVCKNLKPSRMTAPRTAGMRDLPDEHGE